MASAIRRILLLTLSSAVLASCAPQTPPSNLLQTCLDKGFGECLSLAWQQGGWIFLVLAILFILALAILRAYGQGWLDSLKKTGERDGTGFIQRLDISETARKYLEQVSKA